jgi:CBS domain-containing protein
MQTDDRDIEQLLETTDWEPAEDYARTEASLARLIGRLDQRRHRMHMVARTSCALSIIVLVMVTGMVWYRWTRPMVTAVHETQTIPAGVVRLVPVEVASAPSALQRALASLTGRDPRGLLTSVREVAGTGLLRAELAGGTGHLLLLPGHGVVGIVAPSSKSAQLAQGFTAITPGDAPGVTAHDIAAARSIASYDAVIAHLGSPADGALQVANVYQLATPYKEDYHATPYDPFDLYVDGSYVRMRRIVAVTLKPQRENQTLLTALVDIDGHRVVGIVDTTDVVGIILTNDPGPQVVLSEP